MIEDVFEKVETFIRRLHNMDIRIDEKAQSISCKSALTGKPDTNLAMNISDIISQYEAVKEKELAVRKTYALVCLIWINKAYALNVISESNSTLKKISDRDAQIAALEQKLGALQADYDDLQKTHQKVADDNIAWQSKLEQLREDYDKLVEPLYHEGSVMRG